MAAPPWNFDGFSFSQVVVRGDVIYAAGTADYYSQPRSLPLVVSYLDDGTPNPEFNAGRPRLVLAAGRSAALTSLTVQPDGKLVIAGLTNARAELHRTFVGRLNASGTLDRTFGTDGIRVFRSHRALVDTAALDAVGRVYLAATVAEPGHDTNPIADVLVRRLLPDGTVDATFGRHGRQVIDQRRFDSLAGLAVTADGRAVLALTGMSFKSYGEGIPVPKDPPALLVRLGPGGHMDRTFADDGLVPFRIQHNSFNAPASAQVDCSGRVVVGVTSQDLMGVRRWLPNGQPDPGYGIAGTSRTHSPASPYMVSSGTLTRQGYVFAGFDFSYGRDTYLARFARNGGLDPGFGTGGEVILRLWPISKWSMEIVSTVTDGGHGRLFLGGSAGYTEETARLTRMIAS